MKLTKYERLKKWREENKDKHREQWLRYYREHKEEIKKRRSSKLSSFKI